MVRFNFSREGWDGTLFSDFDVRKDSMTGPGWFIYGYDKNKFGVNLKTGKGNYVQVCGYVRKRKARNYNGKVRCGWRTKRDAQAALSKLLAERPELKGV